MTLGVKEVLQSSKNLTSIFFMNFDSISLQCSKNVIYIRKTWKGMKQTKMEGMTERHLPKTDDSVVWPVSEHR